MEGMRQMLVKSVSLRMCPREMAYHFSVLIHCFNNLVFIYIFQLLRFGMNKCVLMWEI